MLACMAFSLGAVPAKPGKIRYTQPDGTVIEIVKHGDEWMHWTTDTEGRLLRLDKDGYYRVSDETATQYRSRLRAKASERRSHSRRPSSSMTVGERHIPVILASFLDQDFQVGEPNTKFHNLLNQDGYSYNGATGSVRNFYEDNSHGKFLPVFDVYGPVTLPGEMATYGEYTCFAPTNEAIEQYLREKGYASVADIPDIVCDTIGQTHLLNNPYFTTDLVEGAFPSPNRLDRYLSFSCDSGPGGTPRYYVNKDSWLMRMNDTVQNGVVHVVDRVI